MSQAIYLMPSEASEEQAKKVLETHLRAVYCMKEWLRFYMSKETFTSSSVFPSVRELVAARANDKLMCWDVLSCRVKDMKITLYEEVEHLNQMLQTLDMETLMKILLLPYRMGADGNPIMDVTEFVNDGSKKDETRKLQLLFHKTCLIEYLKDCVVEPLSDIEKHAKEDAESQCEYKLCDLEYANSEWQPVLNEWMKKQLKLFLQLYLSESLAIQSLFWSYHHTM